MTLRKRLFDLGFASFLLVVFAPVILVCATLILICDRHSPFFPARRMKSTETSFIMWKLRTMRGCDDGLPTGPHKACQTTRLGQVLRKWHLDELPQLWNVLIGDMSLIGPRPPTEYMVSQFPSEFAPMLMMRPGITGLATVSLGRQERILLANTCSAGELEEVYATRILPQKLMIEKFYRRAWSLRLDIWVLLRTCRVILAPSTSKQSAAGLNWIGNKAGLWQRISTMESHQH